MALLNINIPSFKAIVKKSFFTKNHKDVNEYYDVYVFGIQSLAGKILTFHIITDNGMIRSRVPISEIYTQKPKNDIPFYYKQLWDCFSENVSIIEYDFLAFHKAQIILRDGSKIWGTYLFTVDWFNNPYSDEPSDYKCGHIFESDDGYLLCQPNNRLLWKDSNWITKKIPKDLKQFKVDTELPSVENQCDKWLNVEDSNTYYYEFKESSNSKPIKYKKRTPTLKRKIKDFNYLKPLNLKNYV
ncbi:MAG: hypothetical protein EXR20_02395 [Bacteroidetes bacterium]|jgi:hypothetical protein|nr:hypothetical protein [Bacteroidota bacterium]